MKLLEDENNKKQRRSIGGLVFVGCMFLGAGIGIYYGSMKMGGAIGMGIGFLAMAAIRLYNDREQEY